MSFDKDVASTAFPTTSHEKGLGKSQVGRTGYTEAETGDGEDLAQGCKTSKIGHLARHLLYATSNEKDGALKDVVARKLHCFSKGEYPYALKQASSAIEQSFGCKIIHRSNQSHIVRMKYIDDYYSSTPKARARKGLLSAILMFIFASKNEKTNVRAVTETALLNFLKALGLSYSTPDPIFGDVRKLISPTPSAEFIHEGYVSFTKFSDRCESQVVMYDWGPRAILVCEPTVMLNSFCNIMKDPDVDKWSSQVETVKHLEEEKKQIFENSEQYMHVDL